MDGTSHPQLKDHVVVYLDILGLTDQIRESDEPQVLFENYYSAVGSALEKLQWGTEGDHPMWRHRTFSDNIVLAVPVTSALSAIAEFQLSLALAGWFSRGGAAVGKFYIDEHIVYGPAFLDAYKLENETARVPRVLLTQELAQQVKKYLKYYSDPAAAPQNEYILNDGDGQMFLNYLSAGWLDEAPDGSRETLASHRDLVVQRLAEYREQPHIYSKYRWVAVYHNFFCEECADVNSLAVPYTDLEPRPQRLAPSTKTRDPRDRWDETAGST